MNHNESINGSSSNQTNSSNNSASFQNINNETGSNSSTIGIAVGVPLPILILLGGVFWYRRRRKERRLDETQTQTTTDHYNQISREFSKIPRNAKDIENFLLDLQNKGQLTIYNIKDSADKLEKFEDLFLFKELGKGGSGTVFKAIKKPDYNEVYALKLICENFVDVGEKQTMEKIGRLIDEVVKLKDSHHVFIIDVYGIAYAIQENTIKIGIVEELMDMDLKNYMKSDIGLKLNLKEKFEIGGNLIKAFHDYHKKGYIHLDVKPANILINLEDRKLKIADMGEAIKLQSNNKEGVELTGITRLYSSPENLLLFIEKKRIVKIDPRNDIWSLGLILYLIFIGKFAGVIPWIPLSIEKLSERKVKKIIREEQLKKSEFCKENNSIHAKIIEMLNKFLQVDIERRLNQNEMLDTFFECRNAVLEEDLEK